MHCGSATSYPGFLWQSHAGSASQSKIKDGTGLRPRDAVLHTVALPCTAPHFRAHSVNDVHTPAFPCLDAPTQYASAAATLPQCIARGSGDTREYAKETLFSIAARRASTACEASSGFASFDVEEDVDAHAVHNPELLPTPHGAVPLVCTSRAQPSSRDVTLCVTQLAPYVQRGQGHSTIPKTRSVIEKNRLTSRSYAAESMEGSVHGSPSAAFDANSEHLRQNTFGKGLPQSRVLAETTEPSDALCTAALIDSQKSAWLFRAGLRRAVDGMRRRLEAELELQAELLRTERVLLHFEQFCEPRLASVTSGVSAPDQQAAQQGDSADSRRAAQVLIEAHVELQRKSWEYIGEPPLTQHGLTRKQDHGNAHVLPRPGASVHHPVSRAPASHARPWLVIGKPFSSFNPRPRFKIILPANTSAGDVVAVVLGGVAMRFAVPPHIRVTDGTVTLVVEGRTEETVRSDVCAVCASLGVLPGQSFAIAVDGCHVRVVVPSDLPPSVMAPEEQSAVVPPSMMAGRLAKHLRSYGSPPISHVVYMGMDSASHPYFSTTSSLTQEATDASLSNTANTGTSHAELQENWRGFLEDAPVGQTSQRTFVLERALLAALLQQHVAGSGREHLEEVGFRISRHIRGGDAEVLPSNLASMIARTQGTSVNYGHAHAQDAQGAHDAHDGVHAIRGLQHTGVQETAAELTSSARGTACQWARTRAEREAGDSKQMSVGATSSSQDELSASGSAPRQKNRIMEDVGTIYLNEPRASVPILVEVGIPVSPANLSPFACVGARAETHLGGSVSGRAANGMVDGHSALAAPPSQMDDGEHSVSEDSHSARCDSQPSSSIMDEDEVEDRPRAIASVSPSPCVVYEATRAFNCAINVEYASTPGSPVATSVCSNDEDPHGVTYIHDKGMVDSTKQGINSVLDECIFDGVTASHETMVVDEQIELSELSDEGEKASDQSGIAHLRRMLAGRRAEAQELLQEAHADERVNRLRVALVQEERELIAQLQAIDALVEHSCSRIRSVGDSSESSQESSYVQEVLSDSEGIFSYDLESLDGGEVSFLDVALQRAAVSPATSVEGSNEGNLNCESHSVDQISMGSLVSDENGVVGETLVDVVRCSAPIMSRGATELVRGSAGSAAMAGHLAGNAISIDDAASIQSEATQLSDTEFLESAILSVSLSGEDGAAKLIAPTLQAAFGQTISTNAEMVPAHSSSASEIADDTTNVEGESEADVFDRAMERAFSVSGLQAVECGGKLAVEASLLDTSMREQRLSSDTFAGMISLKADERSPTAVCAAACNDCGDLGAPCSTSILNTASPTTPEHDPLEPNCDATRTVGMMTASEVHGARGGALAPSPSVACSSASNDDTRDTRAATALVITPLLVDRQSQPTRMINLPLHDTEHKCSSSRWRSSPVSLPECTFSNDDEEYAVVTNHSAESIGAAYDTSRGPGSLVVHPNGRFSAAADDFSNAYIHPEKDAALEVDEAEKLAAAEALRSELAASEVDIGHNPRLHVVQAMHVIVQAPVATVPYEACRRMESETSTRSPPGESGVGGGGVSQAEPPSTQRALSHGAAQLEVQLDVQSGVGSATAANPEMTGDSKAFVLHTMQLAPSCLGHTVVSAPSRGFDQGKSASRRVELVTDKLLGTIVREAASMISLKAISPYSLLMAKCTCKREAVSSGPPTLTNLLTNIIVEAMVDELAMGVVSRRCALGMQSAPSLATGSLSTTWPPSEHAQTGTPSCGSHRRTLAAFRPQDSATTFKRCAAAPASILRAPSAALQLHLPGLSDLPTDGALSTVPTFSDKFLRAPVEDVTAAAEFAAQLRADHRQTSDKCLMPICDAMFEDALTRLLERSRAHGKGDGVVDMRHLIAWGRLVRATCDEVAERFACNTPCVRDVPVPAKLANLRHQRAQETALSPLARGTLRSHLTSFDSDEVDCIVRNVLYHEEMQLEFDVSERVLKEMVRDLAKDLKDIRVRR